MRRWGVLVAVLAACVAAPAPAGAQTGDLPYLDAVDAWADAQTLRRTLPEAGATPRKRARTPSRKQLATLRFTRTQAVTGASHAAILALLDPSYDRATVVADLVRLQGRWDDEMRGLTPGLEPDNLGDVAAYALILSFAAYHERTTLPDAGVKAVRRAARHDLARQRAVRASSDARKQEAAEMLSLRTLIRVSDLNWGRQGGDEDAALGALRTWVRDAFGIDLERTRFTRRGLVDR